MFIFESCVFLLGEFIIRIRFENLLFNFVVEVPERNVIELLANRFADIQILHKIQFLVVIVARLNILITLESCNELIFIYRFIKIDSTVQMTEELHLNFSDIDQIHLNPNSHFAAHSELLESSTDIFIVLE